MEKEKNYAPSNGYLILVIALLLVIFPILGLILTKLIWLIAFLVIGIFLLIGFFVVNPNESMVLVLFGAYKGTVKKNGFWWANPFFTKKKISLRARNLESEPIKVNDKV